MSWILSKLFSNAAKDKPVTSGMVVNPQNPAKDTPGIVVTKTVEGLKSVVPPSKLPLHLSILKTVVDNQAGTEYLEGNLKANEQILERASLSSTPGEIEQYRQKFAKEHKHNEDAIRLLSCSADFYKQRVFNGNTPNQEELQSACGTVQKDWLKAMQDALHASQGKHK